MSQRPHGRPFSESYGINRYTLVNARQAAVVRASGEPLTLSYAAGSAIMAGHIVAAGRARV
jgi:hypothetical protein